MAETSFGTDDPRTAIAPAAGFVLAGLALAGLLAPIRNGADDPVLQGAGLLAGVAFVVFLVRRHGHLDREAGAVAAGASLGALLLSGYALNQGVTGRVALPADVTFPLVFGAFLAAGGAIGAAVADFFAIPNSRLRDQSTTTVVLAAVGFLVLIVASAWTLVFAIPGYLLVGELTQVHLVVISQLGTAAGTATIAAGYFALSDRDWGFLDVRIPSLRDVGWVVGGFFLLFGSLVAISQFMRATGVESSSHSTTEQAAQNPEILLVLIPASFLVIGPCEELLYRNVIQKSLYDVFSRAGAVVVGSVIFASVHVLAYGNSGIGAVIASLATIFGLSLVLGTIYERTRNLLVPAAIHGAYNAFVFANLYFTYT